ncbi:NAD(P)H-dependent oxidoreductase [Vibrio sp. 404]|uniref:NAD(P)H-dependent oxidoreductase n=1 Tax=Vibrio marinisediminis TaxID=2758441 RepID=A0A7W2FTK0_9VIBR|nr:NAD(P)H-dependent oxidoreductase [Vibrio marinisediminis]MBA5763997.1 NAD(P)H-dependent oxidoreductase [Vibrio marinisediminis]
MSKKVLVINGNPKSGSLCCELADRYVEESQRSNDVKIVSLSELQFDPNLSEGYGITQPLEPDLVDFQQLIQWSEHVVLILPVWWGGMPAKFKGLFDRTFLPGFAFKYHENKSIPEKLLKGKTADIVLTMDTPPFYYRWFQGNPVHKQLKRTILQFCGFKKISSTYIGPVMNSTPKQRDKWKERMLQLAKNN